MVAARNGGVDKGVGHLRHQTIGDDEIVDAPTSILLTSLETVRPPRVLHAVGIKGTEGIGETAGQEVGEGLALLVGETGIAAVALGILQVNLLVGHIQVATEDDGLHGIELFQIAAESILPRQTII